MYTLANCIVSQAIEDCPSLKRYLAKGKDNYRIGCVIANQYGVQELGEKSHKLRLVKEMPHIVPSMIAMKYKIRGVIGAPSASSGAGLAALAQAYRLVKDGH